MQHLMLGSDLLANLNLPGGAFVSLSAKRKIELQNNVALAIILSECSKEPKCPVGYHKVGTAHAAWGLFGLGEEGCKNVANPSVEDGWYTRAICIPDTVEATSCSWMGEPPFCGMGCPKGSIQLAANNGPDYGLSYIPEVCHPNWWSAFCCEKVRLTDEVEFCGDHDLGSIVLGGGLPGGLPVSLINQRLGLTMAQGDGAELSDEYDRVIGTPSFCHDLRSNGLDKRGDGHGAYSYLAKFHTSDTELLLEGIGDIDEGLNWEDCIDVETVIETYTTTDEVKTMTCSGNRWPQACHHYKSAASVLWDRDELDAPCENCLICPYVEMRGNRRAPEQWKMQHNDDWTRYVPDWMISDGNGCQVDEYPFFRFRGHPNAPRHRRVLVRWIPARQNEEAGRIVRNVCPDRLLVESESRSVQNGLQCTEYTTTITTQIVASVEFENLPADPDRDDYLSRNPCTPRFRDPNADFHDVGFALFTNDPWYGGRPPFDYRNPVPDHLAVNDPWRRDLGDEMPQLLVEPGSVIVQDRNSSRFATPEELLEQGMVECRSEGCLEELAEAGLDEYGEPTLVDTTAIMTAGTAAREEESSLPIGSGGGGKAPGLVGAHHRAHLQAHARAHAGQSDGSPSTSMAVQTSHEPAVTNGPSL